MQNISRRLTKKEERVNNMDVAIGMMLFIFVIANVGGLYFYLRDRKQNAAMNQ